MSTALTHRVRLDRYTQRFFTRLQEVVSRFVQFEEVRWSKAHVVCGVDVAYQGDHAVAVAAAWDLKKGSTVEVGVVEGRVSFPYVPGLLYARECPLMVSAVEAVASPVDVVLVDGHGLAHPRRAGLAVFVGLVLDLPTFGVAKSLLVGTLADWKMNMAAIMWQGAPVGYAFKQDGRRFFVSPGNRVSLGDCRQLFKVLGRRYPLVLTEAHRRATQGVKSRIGR